MARTYELALVVDPRVPDDDIASFTSRYKEILQGAGAEITKEEDWGKRRLAYPIRKVEEGRYLFLYVTAEEAPPWPEVERLILQNEKILRHLVVRTDLDLKRAATKGKKKKKKKADGSADAAAPVASDGKGEA